MPESDFRGPRTPCLVRRQPMDRLTRARNQNDDLIYLPICLTCKYMRVTCQWLFRKFQSSSLQRFLKYSIYPSPPTEPISSTESFIHTADMGYPETFEGYMIKDQSKWTDFEKKEARSLHAMHQDSFLLTIATVQAQTFRRS